MDLPATQAIDEESATQQFDLESSDENSVIGTLQIDDKIYNIKTGITSFGRHPASTIVLNHVTVSKKHAEIEAEPTKRTIFIRDLKSSNGTKINNTKLRALSSYQIKDGDKLIFGQVISIFKLCQSSDDSVIPCTPQVKQSKLIIPDTPDSSMNNSSTSENDVSTVPGTQEQDSDNCFRHPQTLVRKSKSDEHNNILPFTSDDLPSPTSKNKIVDQDIDNIYSDQTQKVITETKCNEPDDNIFELETQRPYNIDEAKINDNSKSNSGVRKCDIVDTEKRLSEKTDAESLENLETQQFVCKSDTNRQSNNVSIYSAETQKITRDDQLHKRKSQNVSIYSAETQKPATEITSDESLENLETQKFACRSNTNRQSNNVSIYSAETQKITLDDQLNKRKSQNVSIYSAETQEPATDITSDESLENLETQQFVCRSGTNRQSNNVSIYSAETQKITLDDQINKRKSQNVSIYCAETQEPATDITSDESLENLETQQFVCRSGTNRQSNNVSVYSAETQKITLDDQINKRKSQNVSIYCAETQEPATDITSDESLENLETQQFVCRSGTNRQSNNVSIYSAETQKITLDDQINKRKSQNISIYCAETQEPATEITSVESLDNLETQQFVCKSDSNNKQPHITSIDRVETQDTMADQVSNQKSEIASIYTAETQRSETKVANDLQDDIDTQKFDENDMFQVPNIPVRKSINKSLQAGKTQDLNRTKSNPDEDKIHETEIFNEEFFENLETQTFIATNSLETINNCMKDKSHCSSKNNINDKKTDIIKSHITSNSKTGLSDIEQKIKLYENMLILEKRKSEELSSNYEMHLTKENNDSGILEKIGNEIENEENFSQNLIQNNPFADCTEKSEIVEGEIVVSRSLNDNKINNASVNDKSMNINRVSLHVKQLTNSDSETDEEGIFENCISVKDNTDQIKKVKEDDSETDEEGVFSSYLENSEQESSLNQSSNKHTSLSFKLKSTSLNQSTINKEKSPVPDSDDSMFDDDDLNDVFSSDDKKNSENSSIDTCKVANDTSINKQNNECASTDIDCRSRETDDLCLPPTQIINIHRFTKSEKELSLPSNIDNNEDENDFLEPTQIATEAKSQELEQNLLQDNNLDKNLKSSRELLDDINFMPTKIADANKVTESNKVNQIDKLDSIHTMRIHTLPDTDASTTAIDSIETIKVTMSEISSQEKESQNLQKIDNFVKAKGKNVSIKSTSNFNPNESLNASNRQLQESVSGNRKKSINNKSLTIDLNNTIESDLNKMFEGPEIKTVVSEPVLHTQQLANILESSQTEDNVKEELNTSQPSPTLSSGRNRRKITLNKSLNLNKDKNVSVNLNDSIENHLNNLFDNNINTEKLSEPDVLMTQQLKNILTSQEESQDTEEYFANLKFKTKRNVIEDPQSQDDLVDCQLSENIDKEIVYKRGTVGFSNDGEPVSTKERVEFLEYKGRSFTSDSQSDSDGVYNTLQNLPNGKNSVSLSTSKNLDLSILSEQKSETKVSINNCNLRSKDFSRKSTSCSTPKFKSNRLQLKNTGNKSLMEFTGNESNVTDSIKLPNKRVLSRGIRGFSITDKKPIESDELVSAASTESEDDSNVVVNVNNPTMDENDSNNVDSDEEFLKNMPDIKVAGTAECPPTASQLASVSDNEDQVIINEIDIPVKWKWYAKKRYDLIYQTNNSCATNTTKEEIQSDNSEPPTPKRVRMNTENIDEILARIQSTSKRTVNTPPKTSARRSDIENTNKPNVTTRAKRIQSMRKSNDSLIDSHDEDVKMLQDNADKSFSNDSSDSDSDISSIIPKYKPLEQVNFNTNIRAHLLKDDDSDQEFELLRKRTEQMLAKPSAYGTKSLPNRKVEQFRLSGQRISPQKSRRQRKSLFDSSNELNITRTKGIKNKQTKSIAGTADKDAFVFQVSAGSSRQEVTTKSGLTIIRNKRSATDNQNHPPKRIKTASKSPGIYSTLQELSVVISPLHKKCIYKDLIKRTNVFNFKQPAEVSSPVNNKRLTKLPKALDNFVLPKSSKSKADLSDVSLIDNSVEEEKNESQNKFKTRGKVATSDKSRSINLSKENLVVETADLKNKSHRSETRSVRSQRTKITKSVNIDKDKNLKESLNNSLINENKELTKGTTNSQKQNKPVRMKKNAKSKNDIPDTHSAQSEESIASNIRSRRNKTVKSSTPKKLVEPETSKKSTKSSQIKNNSDSDNSKLDKSNIIGKRTRSTRACEAEVSDSEVLSKPKTVNKTTRSRRNINTSGKQTETQNHSEELILSKSKTEKTLLSKRQTRKRAGTTNLNTAVVSSSDESQEVADILEHANEKEIKNNRSRRGQTHSHSSNDIFEKPVTRPKRAKVNKSNNNEDLEDNESIEQRNNFSTTRSNRSASQSMNRSYKILFTGERSEVHHEIVKNLGGSEIENPSKCSVLVTDKVRRTFKFLCSLARGIPIVSIKWLDDSNKANRFLDWEDYILKDLAAEKKYKFNLRESLDKARKHKLLDGYNVLLASSIEQPPISELKEMVKCSGGKPLVKAPSRWMKNTVVIINSEDSPNAKKLTSKAPKAVSIYSVEFILSGILRQNLNLEEFKLMI